MLIFLKEGTKEDLEDTKIKSINLETRKTSVKVYSIPRLTQERSTDRSTGTLRTICQIETEWSNSPGERNMVPNLI